MQAGELNRRITLLHKTISYDTVNQPVEVWVEGATIWAAVITSGGREFYAAQKINAEMSVLFKVRYTQAINERMRIKWGNRTFEIIAPPNDVDGKRTELQISAKEVV